MPILHWFAEKVLLLLRTGKFGVENNGVNTDSKTPRSPYKCAQMKSFLDVREIHRHYCCGRSDVRVEQKSEKEMERIERQNCGCEEILGRYQGTILLQFLGKFKKKIK